MYNNSLEKKLLNIQNNPSGDVSEEMFKLAEKLILIDKFLVDIEKVEVDDEICDDKVCIKVENAFSNEEIDEYKEISRKFDEKIEELNFVLNLYKSQKMCAHENFNLPMAMKITKILSSLQEQIDDEKKSIFDINAKIKIKEKDFASKVNDLNKDLTAMRIESNIDENKLKSKFGDLFIDNYKISMLVSEIMHYLISNKYSFDNLIENNLTIKKIVDKYPQIKNEVAYCVGANS